MDKNHLEFLLGEQGQALYWRLFSLEKRLPNFFPSRMWAFMKAFLLSCSSRPQQPLYRILWGHLKLLKKLNSKAGRTAVSCVTLSPTLCGIALALFYLAEDEFFSEKQLLTALQNLVPGIKASPLSYFSYSFQSISLFYIEVEKMRGGIFSTSDCERLKNELKSEVQRVIKKTSQALFLPGIEEELFKNMRHLSQEIRHTYDLPQAMVSLVEYSKARLKFLIILVRVLKRDTPAITHLSKKLPPSLHFSLEHQCSLDMLHKKYPKEASIFTLEIDTRLFLQEQERVLWRVARLYVVRALETMLGDFRDYNGGLFHKENEQLIHIKRSLALTPLSSLLLEELFFTLKPTTMRPLFSPATAALLLSVIDQTIEKEIPSQEQYLIESYCRDEIEVVIFKTEHKEFSFSLTTRLLAQKEEIAYGYLERQGYLYLCFFYQYPPIEKTPLITCIKKVLTQAISTRASESKAILRLNFQGGDPPSLNPRLASDLHCHILATFLFEGLTRLNSLGQAEPAVAEKIERSACGTHYTFYLRPAWWSHGEEVTAYHFERAWKRSLMGNTPSYMSLGCFSHIKNAQEAREKQAPLENVGIYAKNAKTLCVQLTAPSPFFLNLLATPAFFPLYGEGEEPLQFNGPFTLSEWKTNSYLHLCQNPFYWNAKKNKLGGIRISMIKDPYEAYKLFQQQELDLMGDPTSPLPPELLQDPNIQKQLVNFPISRVFWLHCNTRYPPLNNVNLRRALSLSLNRTQLTQEVFVDQLPHLSLLPPKYSCLQGNREGDLERAHAYLKLALKQLGITKQAMAPLVMSHSDLAFEHALAAELKKQWEERLGIPISSQPLSWSSFSAALERGNFQLGGLFRRDLFNHPFFYLSFFRNTVSNPHRWENAEYARLLAIFEKEGHKAETLEKIERLLAQEVPAIPLVNQCYLTLIHKRLRGVNWQENGCLNITELSIDETF